MSELDDIKRENIEQFDQMNTEDLEELLKAKSQSSENTDMEDVFSILEVIEKREKTNPSGKYTGVDAAWDSFQKNYLPSSKDAKSIYDFAEDTKDNTKDKSDVKKLEDSYPYMHSRRPVRHKALLRMACIIASIVIVLFSSTIVARAFGIDLWGAVAKWTNETFGFSVASSPSIEQNVTTGHPVQYNDLKEALADYGISEALAPSWIPEQFILTEINVVDSPKKTLFSAIYYHDSSVLNINITRLNDGTNGTYEKDDENINVYEKNDIAHYVMSNNEQELAVWVYKNYECSISGTISELDIKKMIDSIYER